MPTKKFVQTSPIAIFQPIQSHNSSRRKHSDWVVVLVEIVQTSQLVGRWNVVFGFTHFGTMLARLQHLEDDRPHLVAITPNQSPSSLLLSARAWFSVPLMHWKTGHP